MIGGKRKDDLRGPGDEVAASLLVSDSTHYTP